MQITFSLCLPRDEASVPVVRHICRDALRKLGVGAECVGDIELAVTEACTNVLDHTQASAEEYEVNVDVDESECRISIVDGGSGFDGTDAGQTSAGPAEESGRGIFLMRSVVDDLQFVSEPEEGTVVHLVKRLTLDEGSILMDLARRINGPTPASSGV